MCRYFNSVQSTVFPTAFESDLNMVVSAPTGAGKTGVMELAILRLMTRCLIACVLTISAVRAAFELSGRCMLHDVRTGIVVVLPQLSVTGTWTREATSSCRLAL